MTRILLLLVLSVPAPHMPRQPPELSPPAARVNGLPLDADATFALDGAEVDAGAFFAGVKTVTAIGQRGGRVVRLEGTSK